MSSVIPLRITNDHPAFAGHFPGDPIVPGVVLLDEALFALAAEHGLDLAGCTLASAKFPSVARPGEALELESVRDASGRVRFDLRAAGRTVLTATLDLPPPRVPRPEEERAVPTAKTSAVAPDWVNRAERGSSTLLTVMTWISLRMGRAVSRIVLHGIAAYFFAFAPLYRRNSIAYLRRALGRAPTPLDRYRHILWFATAIHDRVFLLNDRCDMFDVSIVGEELVRAAFDRGQGAFLMGAHLGSFEVVRSVGHRQVGLEVAVAMFGDNARKINAALMAINPALKLDVIELGHVATMLEIRARLDAGAFVGMMGDRSFRDEQLQMVDFLGSSAGFPTGAMRVAAMLRRPVYFMAGLYLGGNRYRVVFEQIADFSATERGGRAAAVQAAIRQYAAILERHCRTCPYNWSNFFDFWRPGSPGASAPAVQR
jgi:predicted LPLAT superfamily acyltransferase